ncbi:Imm1 family immunity protein [Streptomyces sp. NPDC012769]|uniref:Imm1 family immunity protein n=1 Tax=Streptomyces sp. NPDC012769 TaxID=3364848 RepID=UPI0036AA9AD4
MGVQQPGAPRFRPARRVGSRLPLFHDPCSTLPLAQVRAALEQFCQADTGERPDCISWVPGHMNGQRLDRPSALESVETSDPFA